MSPDIDLDNIIGIKKEDERYFSCLYECRELGNSRLSTTELSKLIKIHPSTVSNRIKFLSELKINDYQILDYEKIYGVKLTYYGGIIAEKIVRKKRIMETFMAHIGFTLHEIDKQINEIYITEKMSEQIFNKLISCDNSGLKIKNMDLRCPHGGLIPTGEGRPQPELFYPLKYFSEGTELTIYRLNANIDIHNFHSFYEQVQENNLFPGQKVIWKSTKGDLTTFEDPDSGKKFNVNQQVVDLIHFTDRSYNH